MQRISPNRAAARKQPIGTDAAVHFLELLRRDGPWPLSAIVPDGPITTITTGRDWPDGSKGIEPLNVIMVTAEDSLDHTVVPRLVIAGANLERIKFVRSIKTDSMERTFLLGDDLDELEKAIIEYKAGFATIDPITAFQGKINSSSPTDVRGQLGPLKHLAERTNTAFSTITHPPKSAGDRALDQFIGSQAYVAAARIGHLCTRECRWDEDLGVETGRIFFTNPKNNLHEMMPTLAYRIDPSNARHKGAVVRGTQISWEKESVELTADQAIAAAKAPPRTAKVDQFLREFLANGPAPQREVMEAAEAEGFSSGMITRAKERLRIKPQKAGLHEGWIWQLPKGGR